MSSSRLFLKVFLVLQLLCRSETSLLFKSILTVTLLHRGAALLRHDAARLVVHQVVLREPARSLQGTAVHDFGPAADGQNLLCLATTGSCRFGSSGNSGLHLFYCWNFYSKSSYLIFSLRGMLLSNIYIHIRSIVHGDTRELWWPSRVSFVSTSTLRTSS